MPNEIEQLSQEFTKAMKKIYTRERDELGRNSVRFLEMINNDGGLKTAKKLLKTESSEGFAFLLIRNRLDISMEAIIAEYDWGPLFTSEEKRIARQRLEDCNYKVRDLGRYVRRD